MYSRITYPGNGTNGPFTVNFTLGYLDQDDVTCRVNAEVDEFNEPVYRTITWLTANTVNISGVAPTSEDTIVFQRTVSKETLVNDYEDGEPITEANLDESNKQLMMAIHEVLDEITSLLTVVSDDTALTTLLSDIADALENFDTQLANALAQIQSALDAALAELEASTAANLITFDSSGLDHTSANNVQDAIADLDAAITAGNTAANTTYDPTGRANTDATDVQEAIDDLDAALLALQTAEPAISDFKILHVRDEKSAGTKGGSFVSGAWRTRTLNTETANTIDGASLASNQITLPAGTYDVYATAPAMGVNSHKARLYDITNGATLIMGTTGFNYNANAHVERSVVQGRIILAGETVIELQHICQTTNPDGFGYTQNGFSTTEVYAEVIIKSVEVLLPAAQIPFDPTGLQILISETVQDAIAEIDGVIDALTATDVAFDPSGLSNTVATDVQNAIADLDGAIDAASGVSSAVLLQTYTPSAVASVNMTSVLNAATYSGYIIIIDHLALSGTASIDLAASTNNGSTWNVIGFYSQKETRTINGSTAPSYTGTNNAAPMPLITSSVTPIIDGRIIVEHTGNSGGSGYIHGTSIMGAYSGTTAHACTFNTAGTRANALQLSVASGTFTGTVYLYGIKRT